MWYIAQPRMIFTFHFSSPCFYFGKSPGKCFPALMLQNTIFPVLSIAAPPLFILCLNTLVFVHVSLRPSSQKSSVCSDWSALTGLSRHRPPCFCGGGGWGQELDSCDIIALQGPWWLVKDSFWIHSDTFIDLYSSYTCFITTWVSQSAIWGL